MYEIWKQKLVKSYLNKTSVFDKIWKQTSVFDTSFKIKLFEELQDYKVKSIFETKKLQDSGWREGLLYYKRGMITRVFLREREKANFFLELREFGP